MRHLLTFFSALVKHWHLWLMGVGLAMLGTAGVLLGLSLRDAVRGEEEPGIVQFGLSDATTSTGFVLDRPPYPAESPPASESEPESTPGLEGQTEPVPPTQTPVRITRLVIPDIGVDAPVVTLSIDADGVMQAPSGPEEVGWYDFTSSPGTGGNAVFSGHLDYRNYGPAVFWELRNVSQGDIVQLEMEDGTSYTYVVVSANTYEADNAPIEEIIGPTSRESVTLITCAGTFDRSTRQYSHRLVVRAERL